MRSERPKPIHLLCGRPMVVHVLTALAGLEVARTVVVVGHGAERVTKRVQEEGLGDLHVTFVEQRVQRGTGDAVIVGMTALPDDDVDDDSTVVVLPGDTPLLRPETIGDLVARARGRGQRRHRAVGPHGRPDRLRPGHPRPRRPGACASSSSATPHPRSWPSTRSTRASTASAATCSARRCAASPPTTPRASTTSPTSSACWPAPATRSAPWSWPTRARPRASTTGPSWPRPRPSCGPARTGGGC